MISLLKKEVLSFFDSLTAYLAIGVFLLATSLFMWIIPNENVLDYGYASMDVLFDNGPYLLTFLTAALTMRSLAEERRNGTLEWLLTKPISEWSIIMAKFFGCYFVAILCLLPTWIYYYSLHKLGNPVGNIDFSGVLGSYIGLALLCAIFTSVGILCSSISNNQIVAFILAIVNNYLIFSGLDALSLIFEGSFLYQLLKYLGVSAHYAPLSRGLIDSRDVFYFLALCYLFLYLAKNKLVHFKG